MKEASFFEPYVQPWTTQILGHKLLPLSLGHKVLLRAIESSFALGGKHDLTELASAIFICSRRYTESLEAFRQKWFPKYLRKWARKCGVFDFAEKCALMEQYLADAERIPAFKFPENGEPSTCPAVHSVKVLLMEKLHIPEAQLMDRSWQLCQLDYLAHLVNEGRCEFVDEGAIEEARRAGEALHELLKKGGTLGTPAT